MAVHMRYHLFLQYGWFLQNPGKDLIPTNMHTTVITAQGTVLQFSTEGWTKVFPKCFLAVEHQNRQCCTSITPPDVLGPGTFGLLGHNGVKTMFYIDFEKN